jgi:hypothetical protein
MAELDRMIDPSHPDVRIEHSMARAEVLTQSLNRATALQYAAIEETVTDALAHPEVFVDPERPMTSSQRSEFAERAVVADLAVRLNLSEATVRNRYGDALALRSRLPRLWGEFREGLVSPANAHTAATMVGTLPSDAATLVEFEGAVLEPAMTLAPRRFEMRARVLRERIHHVSLTERYRAAAETRGVFLQNDLDGMAELGWRGPADQVHRAYEGIDQSARALAALPGETRTLDQIRSDVAADLLAERSVAGSPVTVDVAVTIPMLTLLELSDEPATLDGYGPIDADTARRLAGTAKSITRLLTHPATGNLLDVEGGYRPPVNLKRWKEVTDVTCAAVGCMRKARNSDLDHTIDYQYGGKTRADNLMHLCRHHHRLKHMTRWRIEQTPTGAIWTSPTGHQRAVDRPPF